MAPAQATSNEAEYTEVRRLFQARRCVALLNGKMSGPITSLAYFQAVADAVGKLQMSADYIKYLRQRVARLEKQWLGQSRARVRHQA